MTKILLLQGNRRRVDIQRHRCHAGVPVYGYPITPLPEVAESLAERLVAVIPSRYGRRDRFHGRYYRRSKADRQKVYDPRPADPWLFFKNRAMIVRLAWRLGSPSSLSTQRVGLVTGQLTSPASQRAT